MEVDADRHHVPVVLKLLIYDVLVLGLDLLQPDVSVGAVDRDMLIEEELQSPAGMGAESILGVVEAARSLDRGVVPASTAQQKRCKPGRAKWINERRHLHRLGLDTCVADVIASIVDRPFEGQIA